MSRQNNMPAGRDGRTFILPLPSPDLGEQGSPGIDPQLMGGKARSLVRLARLGLPTPPAFAVSSELFQSLRAGGPPLPARLESAGALAALDRARLALRQPGTPLPPGFDAALDAALNALETASGAKRVDGFAVRSSAEIEDQVGTLGAGIYASLLRVPRAGVIDAIREVLAAFLAPAAWVYAAGHPPPRGGQPPRIGGAVLIHPFLDGDAAGTAAAVEHPHLGTGAAGGEAAPLVVRIEASEGHPTERARLRIEDGVREAAAVHGPVEVEWVAQGDSVCFLQMRGYQPAPRPAGPTGDALTVPSATPDPAATPGPGWTWDAAHNPAPLSAAQAGLVQLVDSRCRIGLRQRVVNGYLFWKAAPDHLPPQAADSADNVGAVFQRLRLEVEAALDALPDEPPLEQALALFVTAYQPLFGVVGPACAQARAALADFMRRWAAGALSRLPALLGDVPSVAVVRREAVAALVQAPTAERRQLALDAYLRRFGDESPRWDVAEPTLRETPARLVLLTAGRPQPAADSRAGRATDPDGYRPIADEIRAGLPPAARDSFDRALAAAREAVAVGEDDDALFARLQAVVRRALLAVGHKLSAAGRLDAAPDIFTLPLDVTRAVAAQLASPAVTSTLLGAGTVLGAVAVPPPPPTDLRQLAAAGRRAFEEAVAAPPVVATRMADLLVRGQGGAGGRMLGRAVHHPPTVPLGPDAVLIAATLLPTELPLLTPGALVVETGHALGHVAAQARERGIPAVVGAAGATRAIPEGALILVDGDRGEIVLLERA